MNAGERKSLIARPAKVCVFRACAGERKLLTNAANFLPSVPRARGWQSNGPGVNLGHHSPLTTTNQTRLIEFFVKKEFKKIGGFVVVEIIGHPMLI